GGPAGSSPLGSANLLEAFTGHGNQSGECCRIGHGQVGQDLAVELHPRGTQPPHEARVAHAVAPARRSDPGYPQPSELRLPVPAVSVGIGHGVHDLLLGHAIAARPVGAVVLRRVHDLPASPWASFDVVLDAGRLTGPSTITMLRPSSFG